MTRPGTSVIALMLDDDADRDAALDEVRDRVEYDTRLARRQEVTEQFIGQLMEAAGVKMYPEAFSLGGSAATPETKTP